MTDPTTTMRLGADGGRNSATSSATDDDAAAEGKTAGTRSGHRVGLGLRRQLLTEIGEVLLDARAEPPPFDFMEVAPENWIRIGGRLGRRFAQLAERRPVFLHGLSLNIGGPQPLDQELLDSIRSFMRDHRCPAYSEHLTACGDHAQLYDLMPIPFTGEAVRYVAERVRQVQDRLERRIAMENASYYAVLQQDLSELEFINAVLSEADCGLLLDVNNIHVNSVNHGYDPLEFLRGLPAERVVSMHVAGHLVEAEDLRVDTHAAPVIDPVWELLGHAYRHCGVKPTVLERDFDIPPLADLCVELRQIQRIQADHPWSAESGSAFGEQCVA